MGYAEAFETVKKALKNAKGTGIDRHLAFEVIFTDGDNAGICYLEIKNQTVKFEPYDYVDYDARLIGDSNVLAAVFSGKLDMDAALADERLRVEGDYDAALLVKKIIRKTPGRKPKAKPTK